MADRTWAEIFAALGIEWCPSCDRFRDYHEHGMLTTGNVLHWRNRRMTQPGIYKLLRKVAWSRSGLSGMPLWRQIYLLNQTVLDLAKELGVRLPRKTFDLDRAKLRYALGEHTLADRRRMTPSEQSDFKAAIRWAARS